jgi:hypothetical protein
MISLYSDLSLPHLMEHLFIMALRLLTFKTSFDVMDFWNLCIHLNEPIPCPRNKPHVC